MADIKIKFSEYRLVLLIGFILALSIFTIYMATRDYHEHPIDSPPSMVNTPVGHNLFFQALVSYQDSTNQKFSASLNNLQGVSAEEGRNSLLICFLYPEDSMEKIKALGQSIGAKGHWLIILPKWRPTAGNASGKYSSGDMFELQTIDSMLGILLGEENVKLERINDAVRDSGSEGNTLYIKYPQVLQSDSFRSVLCRNNGKSILGKCLGGYGDITVLTDPDLLANYGLSKEANQLLTMRTIRALLPENSNNIIILDKFSKPANASNLLLSLLRYPLNVLTFFLILIVVTLVWAGWGKKMAYADPSLSSINKKEFFIRAFGSYFKYAKISNHRLALKYYQIKLKQAGRILYVPDSMTVDELQILIRKFLNTKGETTNFDSILKEIERPGPELSQTEMITIVTKLYSLNSKLITYASGRNSALK